MNQRDILENLAQGKISVAEAEQFLKKEAFEDLGFAKLDYNRKKRQGVGEVVYCEGKSIDQLKLIVEKIVEKEGEFLGTRASQDQYECIQRVFSQTKYDPLSRILKLDKSNKELRGNVVICTAGTADVPVAEEAALTAEFFGTKVIRIYDIGVAGIHRLFAHLEELQEANVIISVAGMEGALSSVIGGLVDVPVIAVPTSIGYGANFNGLSALLTSLNSCANGVCVVNIDNGYGAGYLATQINQLTFKNA